MKETGLKTQRVSEGAVNGVSECVCVSCVCVAQRQR